jgi:hypothetical protein
VGTDAAGRGVTMQTYGPSLQTGTSDDWRWGAAPLASATVVFVVTLLTLGAGILLAPLSVAITVIALRRTNSAGILLRLGLAANLLLAIALVATLAIVVHDALIVG